MKRRPAEAGRLLSLALLGQPDQEAAGLASGDVTGGADSTPEGSGAIDSDGLLLEFEQAPTASVAAKISRASNSLTLASSFGGTSPP